MPRISFYIICFATIVSLFHYKKFKNTIYTYFIYFLVFTFIVEILAFSIGHFTSLNKNFIYNSYTIITFIFYFIFYKSIFKKIKNKRIMNIILFFYILFLPFDLIILKTNFLTDFSSKNIVFGSILLIFTIILFLIEIINDRNIVFNIKKSFIFWISIGVLLFYVGITPIFISLSYLNFYSVFDTILTGLNAIMYGSFIVGFILSDKKYHY